MQAPRLLGVLTLAWALAWVQRAALSPVGPAVQAELGLDYTQLGLLSTLGVLGGAAGYLVAGKWGAGRLRACLLGGAALLALATLGAGLAPGYAWLALAQVAGGVGEGLLYVPALVLVTRAFPPERSGRALGTLDLGISAGTFAVLAAGPLLLGLGGWRMAFLAAAALGLVAVLVLGATLPASPREPPARLRGALTRRAALVYGSVTLGLVVYFALIYLAPAFLVTRGFTLPEADLLAAAAVGLGIPWHIAGGWLADRYRAPRVALAGALVFAASLAALALVASPLLTGALLVAAYSLGIVGFVSLIAAVPRVLGVELAAPAFGVFWALGYLGGAFGPLAVGGLADAAGFGPALLALAALAALGGLLMVPLLRMPGAERHAM